MGVLPARMGGITLGHHQAHRYGAKPHLGSTKVHRRQIHASWLLNAEYAKDWQQFQHDGVVSGKPQKRLSTDSHYFHQRASSVFGWLPRRLQELLEAMV